MSRRGMGSVAVAVIVAAGVAAAGAAANLHLLEPQRRSREPVVLGLTVERPSTTTTTTAPPPTTTAIVTTTTTGEEPALRRSYAVGRAGTVTVIVRSGVLAVESVVAGLGWSYEIEDQRSDELEITFRSDGNQEEASFHASVHGGELRVEIEPEDGESPDD
jgi:hypothetical protein